MPIYVAASGPAAARLAGRVGDGFICTSGKGEELYTQTLLPSLAEGAEKAGRDVSGMDRMIEMKVSFDTDYDRAKEDTKSGPRSLPGDKKLGVHDPREMEVLAREAEPYPHPLARLVRPRRARRADRPVHRLGFSHLVFHSRGGQARGDRPLRRPDPAEAARPLRLTSGGRQPRVTRRRAAPRPWLDPRGDLAVVADDPHVHAHDHVPGPSGTGIDTSAVPRDATPGVMPLPSPRFGWSNASNHRIRQPGSTVNVSVSSAIATRGDA